MTAEITAGMISGMIAGMIAGMVESAIATAGGDHSDPPVLSAGTRVSEDGARDDHDVGNL
jgi:hypothetical protein